MTAVGQVGLGLDPVDPGYTPPVETERRDAAIVEDVHDILEHDDRCVGLDVSIAVRGGVIHIDGLTSSDAQRCDVARLLRRVRGVNAVWDHMRPRGSRPLVLVDVGCGRTKQYPDAIGVDLLPGGAVDVCADLRQGLPFASNSVDRLFAIHVLEHIVEPLVLMNEIHRVLRPGGVLHVMTPHWRHVNAVADPTHVRLFGVETFVGYCKPSPSFASFRPLTIAESFDTVFADLEPVKDDRHATVVTLARFLA